MCESVSLYVVEGGGGHSHSLIPDASLPQLPDMVPNKSSHYLCLPFSIIGLSDGLTVPFALTAGLSSLGESKLVVLGGVAELIAGAISMGIGGFLASQAERDHHRYLRRTTKARVQRSCDGEMEREVHAVLGPVGVNESVSRQVALNLLEVESTTAEQSGGLSDAEHGLKWSQSVGLTEFLLKFGQSIGALPHPVCLLHYLGSRHVLRGCPNAPHVLVCLYDRDGLSRRRHDPVNSLLYHPQGAHCARLLVYLHWYRSTHLWRCQGEGYWCSGQRGRWIHMGSSKYISSGWCSSSSRLWHSCPLRSGWMNCLTPPFFLSLVPLLYLVPCVWSPIWRVL